MKHCALVLALASVALLMTACRREQAGGRAHRSPPGGEPRAQADLPNHWKPQAGPDPLAGGGNQRSDEPPPAEDPEDHPGGHQGGKPLLLDEDPPLLLDEDPPLLLDDEEGGASQATGPVADNSRCHVCHLNYADEELAVVHAEANIGCADCHGNCDEHIADESWASGGNGTPPEIMYPREKINPFCLDCHPEEKIAEPEHQAFLEGSAEEKHCTDCHGQHRLKERKCKWR